MTPTPPIPPSTPEGRIGGLIRAVQGLTFTNVLIIALLVVIAIPSYVVWKALNDEKIMDRLMSTYEEVGDQMSGCTIRHVQERGGPDLWGISTGFAFQGRDRWYVNVVIDRMPNEQEIVSYCEAIKLIADKLTRSNGNAT